MKRRVLVVLAGVRSLWGRWRRPPRPEGRRDAAWAKFRGLGPVEPGRPHVKLVEGEAITKVLTRARR